jgi:acyl-CoA thioester hydrolase
MHKTLTCVAHPWLCDVMGHLNTRHYVAMFDDANYVILDRLRPANHGAVSKAFGWADVRNEIDYLAEVPAGAVVDIYTGISRLGTKSLTIAAQMRAPGDAAFIHAKMSATIVYFDLTQRRAAALTPEIQAAARASLIV